MQYSKVSQKMLPLKNKSIEGSSRSHMFFKIGVLKNFANCTAKHLSWSLFLTKFFTDFIKNTPTQMLSCAICKIFKNTFFYRTPQVAATVERDSTSGICEIFQDTFFGRTTPMAASEWAPLQKDCLITRINTTFCWFLACFIDIFNSRIFFQKW